MRVRAATVADVRAIAEVRVRTWRVAYAGLIDDRLLARLDPHGEATARAWRWEEFHPDPRSAEFLAEDEDGAAIGWAAVGPSTTADLPDHGQLFALYALPEHWSTGVGHALLSAAEESLRQSGFQHALLHVLAGNERAERFYERHGWREDGVVLRDERFTEGLDIPALIERQRVRDLAEVLD